MVIYISFFLLGRVIELFKKEVEVFFILQMGEILGVVVVIREVCGCVSSLKGDENA